MINKSNYEEYLVDHLHGELKGDLLQEMEALLAVDEQVAADYALLQQTMLEPDETIVFEHKETLYRRETPTSFMLYRRYFAAAAIVIGMLLSVIYYFNRTAPVTPLTTRQSKGVNTPQNEPRPSNNITQSAAPAPELAADVKPVKREIPLKQRPESQSPRVYVPEPPSPNDEESPEVAQVPLNINKDTIRTTPYPLAPKAELAQNPANDPIPAEEQNLLPPMVEEPVLARNTLQLNETKQPKLFRMLGQLNRLSRKVQDTKQQLAHTEIVVMLGNTKLLNIN